MKKQVQLAVTSAAIGVASLIAVAHSATAQVSFATQARGIDSNGAMVRAMDECSPATTSVLTSGSPPAGCLQANGGSTDDLLGMRTMKVSLNKKGRIKLTGSGFQLGDELRVRLSLRITKTGVSTTSGTQTVTFPNINVDCPKSPDAFNARPNGAVAGSTSLSACLSPNTGLMGAGSSIEVLDWSVVNVANGKVLAVPGLLR